MILKAAPISIECSQQPFNAQMTKCFLGSFSAMNRKRIERSLINCKLLRSQIFDKKCFPKPHGMRRSFSGGFDVKKCFTKPYAMRRSRSENFDESFLDQDALDDAKENGDLHSISKMIRSQGLDLFLQSSVDILDPIALGIRPEAPNWPEREAIRSIRLEQKAKSFTLPCSLRMIRKKIQFHNGFNVLEESASCSVRKALSSMVFIMLELQSSVLKMKEALCPVDLEMILNKLQNDMQFSYAKLFQQVFSRTPALMIYIILLLANFSLHSTSLNMTVAQASLLLACETATLQCSSTDTALCKEDSLQQGNPEFQSVAEVLLWNSMANEATNMQEDEGNEVLDHEELQSFVTPISAVPEADDYLDPSSIETRYQIGLTQEPNNPLLLRNYAKFLLLVNDPDRAEEYFRKAVQVIPPDAESHCLYAEFLWKVRNDLRGAELRYIEAKAIEPENHNIISKYAEFLWNTGAEDNCFQQGNPEFPSAAEVLPWNSMANEATKMQADEGNAVLDNEELQSFVTPISAVPEADDYLDHSSIETRYEIGLTQEPNNPLLLRNYAKFLLLVNDPDRAEEYFKKAVQVIPPDAEAHCLYAEFLWKVRNDLWEAELRYIEAIAVEPENHNIISKYAEFLWNTGAEDTCFPLDYSN